MIARTYFSKYSWLKRMPLYYCSSHIGDERRLDLCGDSMRDGISVYRRDGEFQLFGPDPFFVNLSIRKEAVCPSEVCAYNAMSDHEIVEQTIFLASQEIIRPERVITALALLCSKMEEAQDYAQRKRLPARTLDAVLDFAAQNDVTVTMHTQAALARMFHRPMRAR